MSELAKLLEEYKQAPDIFKPGRYWRLYEDKIISEIEKTDINELRSGKYPIYATFGFTEAVYNYHPNMNPIRKMALKTIRSLFITGRNTLPYSLGIENIREMAYNHCVLHGELAGIKPISEIEVCTFGNPQDIFEINGKPYTMAFLSYYIRLCYAQRHFKLKGDETIVELGSGSGHQVEVLKKVFPDLTILCFDLPYILYLGYEYLYRALGTDVVELPSKGLEIKKLENIEKGKVHMFGNWQMPMLPEFNFDVFWNAASFGEMEPHIVENYLSYVRGSAEYIYLLQARHGKESSQSTGVVTPIKFEDYDAMMKGYNLVDETDAYLAHRKFSQSGGYFQAIWKKNS